MATILAKPSLKKQSFCKILFGDFSQRLRIPPKFIENFNGQSIRECALKGPSGIRRAVALEQRKNGLFFHDGWQGFVMDHHLEDGDFLVFSYNGESQFKVKIYDRTACEKDVEVAEKRSASPVPSVNKGQAQGKEEICGGDNENFENKANIGNYALSRKRPEDHPVEATSKGSISFKSKNLCFAIPFKKHYQHRMTIPKSLATAKGLMSKKSLTIRDPTGRSWLVKLRVRACGKPSQFRLEMTSPGLLECCRSNQIVPGDTVVFEFVKQSVAQIHIFRKGSSSVVLAAPGVKNES